jgi:hypothetical protein
MRISRKNRNLIRFLMIVLVSVIGLSELAFSSLALHPSLIYRKDFIQEYLLAKAVLTGTEPYRPLPEMTAELLDYHPRRMIPHPATHPPPMAVFSLPLALLSYQQAAAVWLVLQSFFVAVSAYLLLRWWKVRPLPGTVLAATLMAFVWPPLIDEMLTGQLNTLLLLLLLLAWQRLREGYSVAGGAWLGGALIVKLMAWPVVLFLLLCRSWRAVLASGVVVTAAHLMAAAFMGWGSIINYYRNVAPTVPPMVRANVGNFSAWSVGWRLFEGIHCEILPSTVAPPLVYAPDVARVVSLILLLMLLAGGVWIAGRSRSFDTAFGVLICVSVLINPVVWSHYLVMTAIPAAIAFRRLVRGNLPRWIYCFAFGCGVLLFFPRMEMHGLMHYFEVNREIRDGDVIIRHVPFAAGLISLLPMLAVLSLMWLVWRLDRFQPVMKDAPACDAVSFTQTLHSDEVR